MAIKRKADTLYVILFVKQMSIIWPDRIDSDK